MTQLCGYPAEQVAQRHGIRRPRRVALEQRVNNVRGIELSLTTFGEAIGPILDAAQQVRLTIPIATSENGLDPRYITSARMPPGGLFMGSSVVWEPATHPAQHAFVRAYQARFDSVPGGVSALAYDAVR